MKVEAMRQVEEIRSVSFLNFCFVMINTSQSRDCMREGSAGEGEIFLKVLINL